MYKYNRQAHVHVHSNRDHHGIAAVYIGNMRQKREEFMNKESWRLNMRPLFP